MTLPLDLADITEAFLQSLILSKEQESERLEFKRQFTESSNGKLDADFLGDVSAFANSGGGDLVYGLDEDGEGQAHCLVPIKGNVDSEILRIQDALMYGVEPRLPGVKIQPVSVEGGFVVVIRVPQSWAAPHRVKHKSNQHFYIRDGRRKRPLDVPEVRARFVNADSFSQKIRDFRTERLGKILSGEAIPTLKKGATFVVHMFPLDSALGQVAIDLAPYAKAKYLPIFEFSVHDQRINVDGVLAFRNSSDSKASIDGYSHLFRNGFFEVVEVLERGWSEGTASLGSNWYERKFIEFLEKFRKHQSTHSLGHACLVTVSLLNATQTYLATKSWAPKAGQPGFFDRAHVLMPDVLLPAEGTPEQVLRPVFDLVWQAAGYPGCNSFAPDGAWVG